MFSGGAFLDQKEILIVSFHKIFFPGVFFHQCRVGFELIQLLLCDSDLLLVVLLAFLQFLKLGPFPKMTCNKVPGVKEQYPYNKSNRCKEVFVL